MFIMMWLHFMLDKKIGAMVRTLPLKYMEVRGLNPHFCNFFTLV